jgi:hypothetical protein
MIFVDRALEPTPKELLEDGVAALDELRKFFSTSSAARASNNSFQSQHLRFGHCEGRAATLVFQQVCIL